MPGCARLSPHPGFRLEMSKGSCRLAPMKGEDIKGLAERNPFRPFVVRVVNGAQYSFKEAREFGAPKDYHMIFFFGETEAVRIDTESIVEVIER